jgi:regulation of enolase protein 1 (concanavalin A-like superfamily)
VTLTEPANGATFTAPATITLTADASDPENRLARVDFYAGTTLLGSDSAAPFEFTWSAVPAGTYPLIAVAHDSDGAETTSAAASVTVQAANQPPTVTLTSPANGATFTAPATITLAADASDPENRLNRVEFFSGATQLGSDTTAPYAFDWASVPAGSYTLTAVAHDSDGGSATSSAVAITVNGPPPPPDPLPDGQQNQDIGNPAIAGSVIFDSGTYSVSGAGENIWGASDQFHFVHRQVTGDVDIVARVVSLDGTNEWSKAGVMVRESLDASARHALAHVTTGNGYRTLRRIDTAGATSSIPCGPGTTPGWVRLVRRGDLFEMHYSIDGQTWSGCGSTQIAMAPTVYVGLAVSSVDAAAAVTAVFDNLAVTSGPTSNQPPTVTLTEPANGATFTAPATITLTADASDPENRLARVDFYAGTTLLGSDLTAPYSFAWSGVAAGTYVLSALAVDADGANTRSSTVTVTVSGTPPPSSTWTVTFAASTDHESLVSSYLLEVFTAGADPNTATPVASSDLGKPTPDASQEIAVDRSSVINALAAGNYIATVSAMGEGGRGRSAPYSFTR